MTREEWLTIAISKLSTGVFKHAGLKVPIVRVSVGLPHGRGSKKIIGQHWHPEASDDKLGCIFISPTIADSELVLSTLVHELVHAAVGNDAGHGPAFKRAALAVGLEGKMRSTVAGSKLKSLLQRIVGGLGPIPHSALNISAGPIKKQSTRMVKMECYQCGYIARASRKCIDEFGACLCPCNGLAMSVEGENELRFESLSKYNNEFRP